MRFFRDSLKEIIHCSEWSRPSERAINECSGNLFVECWQIKVFMIKNKSYITFHGFSIFDVGWKTLNGLISYISNIIFATPSPPNTDNTLLMDLDCSVFHPLITLIIRNQEESWTDFPWESESEEDQEGLKLIFHLLRMKREVKEKCWHKPRYKKYFSTSKHPK